jgi:tetratricopeptide (TPR) repeat protein
MSAQRQDFSLSPVDIACSVQPGDGTDITENGLPDSSVVIALLVSKVEGASRAFYGVCKSVLEATKVAQAEKREGGERTFVQDERLAQNLHDAFNNYSQVFHSLDDRDKGRAYAVYGDNLFNLGRFEEAYDAYTNAMFYQEAVDDNGYYLSVTWAINALGEKLKEIVSYHKELQKSLLENGDSSALGFCGNEALKQEIAKCERDIVTWRERYDQFKPLAIEFAGLDNPSRYPNVIKDAFPVLENEWALSKTVPMATVNLLECVYLAAKNPITGLVMTFHVSKNTPIDDVVAALKKLLFFEGFGYLQVQMRGGRIFKEQEASKDESKDDHERSEKHTGAGKTVAQVTAEDALARLEGMPFVMVVETGELQKGSAEVLDPVSFNWLEAARPQISRELYPAAFSMSARYSGDIGGNKVHSVCCFDELKGGAQPLRVTKALWREICDSIIAASSIPVLSCEQAIFANSIAPNQYTLINAAGRVEIHDLGMAQVNQVEQALLEGLGRLWEVYCEELEKKSVLSVEYEERIAALNTTDTNKFLTPWIREAEAYREELKVLAKELEQILDECPIFIGPGSEDRVKPLISFLRVGLTGGLEHDREQLMNTIQRVDDRFLQYETYHTDPLMMQKTFVEQL